MIELTEDILNGEKLECWLQYGEYGEPTPFRVQIVGDYEKELAINSSSISGCFFEKQKWCSASRKQKDLYYTKEEAWYVYNKKRLGEVKDYESMFQIEVEEIKKKYTRLRDEQSNLLRDIQEYEKHNAVQELENGTE